MIVQLKNDCLTVAISDIGAELQSVRGADGTEYLWQGDKASWADRAPVLFPFCGRLWEGKCTDAGIPCNPEVHGFLRFMTTEVTEKSDTSVTFRARDNAETLKNYPYPFEVRLTFSLQDRTLTTRTEIVNRGERVMPFALGLHPGFSLPFAGGIIGDYTVRFEGATGILQRLNFDEGECFPTGGSRDFPLRDGEFFDPTEDFFEAGSAFFCEMPRSVMLEKRETDRRIAMNFPDFRYFGLWKVPGARFLCMEPWTSLPALHGVVTELTEKPDLIRLAAGEQKSLLCTVTFC